MEISAILLSYLVGSIPVGYLVGLTQGVDIRTVGSGNIGATNVFRTFGKKLGILTFLCDVGKGVVATCLLVRLVEGRPVSIVLLCGIAALLGHCFPCFLKFRGGKGVATGLGIAIGLVPHCAGLALITWIVCFLITRYVSVASCIAATEVGVLCWFIDRPAAGDSMQIVLPVLVSLLAFSVVLKHHGNIKRLIQGTENRFCFTKRQAEEKARRQAAQNEK